MSATVDADKFGHYWGCPVLYVAGRQHAVSVRSEIHHIGFIEFSFV